MFEACDPVVPGAYNGGPDAAIPHELPALACPAPPDRHRSSSPATGSPLPASAFPYALRLLSESGRVHNILTLAARPDRRLNSPAEHRVAENKLWSHGGIFPKFSP